MGALIWGPTELEMYTDRTFKSHLHFKRLRFQTDILKDPSNQIKYVEDVESYPK